MSLLTTLYRGGWCRAVDHALAESLRRLQPQTPDLVLVAAALTSRAIAQGHVHLPLQRVHELLAEIVFDNTAPPLPNLDEWRDVLCASPWVAVATPQGVIDSVNNSPLIFQSDALSLRRYWHYETSLANNVLTRLQATPTPLTPAINERLAQLFPDLNDEHVNHQSDATRAVLTRKLVLLTGGPGTGKTSTIAKLLVLFHEFKIGKNPPRIAMAAPTGKAASRMHESICATFATLIEQGLLDANDAALINTNACTLHRLLGSQRDSRSVRYHAEHPIPADLVIIDEASMIDLPMMHRLLDAVAKDATLVLIGDRDQLPSIETGDVLASLCDAAKLSPVMAQHHVHLQRIHRQANDSDVPTLARWVRDGDASAALAGLRAQQYRGVHWQHGPDRDLADAVLTYALPAYRAVRDAPCVADALALAKRFRILTAVREGAAGSQTLNSRLSLALDPTHRGIGFFHGRLIQITVNNYRQALFNGDIGIAWRNEQGETHVWFESEHGPRAFLPTALPLHESAFALTVHKAQGSEFDSVLLALPERGARVLSRELLYTGLTRCRNDVTLWASETSLRDCIGRQSQRWSDLAHRLTAA